MVVKVVLTAVDTAVDSTASETTAEETSVGATPEGAAPDPEGAPDGIVPLPVALLGAPPLPPPNELSPFATPPSS